jgi:hypothetical protein
MGATATGIVIADWQVTIVITYPLVEPCRHAGSLPAMSGLGPRPRSYSVLTVIQSLVLPFRCREGPAMQPACRLGDGLIEHTGLTLEGYVGELDKLIVLA